MNGEHDSASLIRRDMLKLLGATATTATASNAIRGGPLISPVSATEDTAAQLSATVEQGDKSFEITALENGETIEQFYNYENAQSNTTTNIERSDTSQLFLWNGPNGLSLVVLHDKPNDESGGACTFEIDGLPTDAGQWVVQDDGGDFASATDTTVDWSWNQFKTDGGVFRGGLDDGFEITITPRFNDAANKAPLSPGQITDWEVLSGDADDPDRISINLDEPITIRTDGQPIDLEGQLDLKRSLITDIRSAVPGEYLVEDQGVDEVASEFTANTRRQLDNFSQEERVQYSRAFRRLNTAEGITKRVTRDAIENVISKTSLVILEAAVATAISGVRSALTGIRGLAKDSLAKRTARQGRSVADTTAADESFDLNTRTRINNQIEDGTATYRELYDDAEVSDRDAFQSAAETAAETGLLDLVSNKSGLRDDVINQLPGDFVDEFTSAAERFTAAIEGLFFQGYYFSTVSTVSGVDFDIDPPTFDLDPFEVTVDIPLSLSTIDGVPPQVGIRLPISTELENVATELTSSIDSVLGIFDEVGDIATSSNGVDSAISQGTRDIRNSAEAGELSAQDSKTRADLVNNTVSVINAVSGLTNAVFSTVNTISKFVFAAQVAILITVIVTVLVTLTKSLLAGVGVPLAANFISFVGTAIAKVAVIDLVLITINFATVGLSLQTYRSVHFASVFRILNTDLQGDGS